MIELTSQQRPELSEAPPRVLDPLTGNIYILISEDVYERIQDLLVADRLTLSEQQTLLQAAGRRAGWDDPEMDVYDREALATHVEVSEDTLTVELADGRTIAVPLAWYPRLAHATAEERGSWRLSGGGRGIHWSAVDEDISVSNLLAGQPSAESQSSFKKWLASREKPGRNRKRDEAG
jgi:hypothetical protein